MSPYKSMTDVNPAIRGIKPKVTLAQASMISSWADAMENSTSANKPENPYATSVAQFKRLYSVQDGKWVQKQQETRRPRKTQEAFKTIDGKKRPASDFLVAVDKNKPGTWALPVKVNGRVDHRLMGAAWAALHGGGYRGNKYEGPDKQKAIDKLKALYKREDMPLPTEETMTEALIFQEDEQFDHAVIIEKDGKFYHVPFRDDQLASLSEWREVTRQWVFVEQDEPQPGGPEMCVCPECGAEAEHEAGLPCRAMKCPKCGAMMIAKVETTEANFTESASGAAISLVEAEAQAGTPLSMDVCLIQPGWGNERDNNYYPQKVLKRDAHHFVGAKMFEKDHTNDKTTRDWVSTVDSIVGETAEGGPIARVVIHDPNFGERVRALEKAGKLNELPCSIMARGTARPYELDGKNGNQVEAITGVSAVDWVTAAGAGGHALSLSEREVNSVNEETTDKQDVEEIIEASEDSTEVNLTEDAAPEAGEPQVAEPVVDTSDEQEPEVEEEPQLTGGEVNAALEAAKLPAAARAKLEAGQYTEAQLTEAIKAEKAYISNLTEAGKPFGHSTSQATGKVDLSEVQKRQEEINAKWIGSRTRPEVKHD